MEIQQITDNNEKKTITRKILEALPEWFEVEESREEYIRDSEDKIFLSAVENGEHIGFLYLKETGKDTVEIAVMGVLKEYHRQGVGRQLFENAEMTAKNSGYSFIQVKTVKMGMYEDYDRTNMFYQSVGFKEFEIFPTFWDELNPCQIYVKAL
ncbi:MAG: GNAT family N-acetyltransferase [Ruminococcus sp.]|nr:GNAT family N-acetyltransferase [Ruminococcus sp.]